MVQVFNLRFLIEVANFTHFGFQSQTETRNRYIVIFSYGSDQQRSWELLYSCYQFCLVMRSQVIPRCFFGD